MKPEHEARAELHAALRLGLHTYREGDDWTCGASVHHGTGVWDAWINARLNRPDALSVVEVLLEEARKHWGRKHPKSKETLAILNFLFST